MDVAWVMLSLVERMGGKTLRALVNHFGSADEVLIQREETALRRVPGVGSILARRIIEINHAAVANKLTKWEAAGVQIIDYHHPAYPSRLKALSDAPATLFVRGALLEYPRTVGIVGTRNPTPRGVEMAWWVGTQAAQRGCAVISGLAMGIDGAAHQAALNAGGVTVGVLGNGVLNIYPPMHNGLAEQMTQRGAIISEVQPYAAPSPSNLVARNRIISGLSDVLIVVESSSEGGAMYAARFAGEQGRPIYVVHSPATGNQALLANGAQALNFDKLPF